jgi:hypothetical protein
MHMQAQLFAFLSVHSRRFLLFEVARSWPCIKCNKMTSDITHLDRQCKPRYYNGQVRIFERLCALTS